MSLISTKPICLVHQDVAHIITKIVKRKEIYSNQYAENRTGNMFQGSYNSKETENRRTDGKLREIKNKSIIEVLCLTKTHDKK